MVQECTFNKVSKKEKREKNNQKNRKERKFKKGVDKGCRICYYNRALCRRASGTKEKLKKA